MLAPDTKSVHYTLGVLIGTLNGIKSTLPLVEIGEELNNFQKDMVQMCISWIGQAEKQIAFYQKERDKVYQSFDIQK